MKLLAQLSGDCVLMGLAPAASRGSILARLAALGSSVGEGRSAVASPDHSAPVRCVLAPGESLQAGLEKAWSALAQRLAGHRAARDMEAQVGFKHSRVGLLRLDESMRGRLSQASGAAIAEAWVRDNWGVDSQESILRWHQLAQSNTLLVSCVNRATYNDLDHFCTQNKLRFVSCLPAVMRAWDNVGEAAPEQRTIAWLERDSSGGRGEVVQLTRHDDRGMVSASWRGLLSATQATDGRDDALAGALRRFQAYCQASPGEGVMHRFVAEPRWEAALAS